MRLFRARYNDRFHKDDRRIVIVSPEAMNSLPTNKHQIATRLASRGWRVLYVVARPVPLGSRERQNERWLSWKNGCRVLVPYGIPRSLERRSSTVLRVNQFLVLFQANVARLITNSRGAATIVYFPPAWRHLRGGKPAIYHLVDHFPTFPEWSSHGLFMSAADISAAKTAKSVWVSSPGLAEYLRPHRPDVKLLANVADARLFSTVSDMPFDAKTMVFAGALSAHKVDLELIRESASLLPDWRILLVGPHSDPEAQPLLDTLKALPNVHLRGRVAHQDLPEILAQAEVLLLPYRISEHTAHVLPLKLFEYLATGRRVASVPLESMQEFAHVVDFFSNADDLVQIVNQEARSSPRDRIYVALQHDWVQRIDEIERALLGNGA